MRFFAILFCLLLHSIALADAISPSDAALLPKEVVKSLRDSNRVLVREMREFRASQAVVLLDKNGLEALDKAIALFDRYQGLGHSPEEMAAFFNEISELAIIHPTSIALDEVAGWRDLPPCKLERGDIVLAWSTDIWAEHFANASSHDKRFSHIAVVLTGGPKAVLVETGTSDDADGETLFAKCGWEDVCGGAIDCAVFRFSGNKDVRARIGDEAEKRVGVLFDASFDLKTKKRLYCAEMVRDSVNAAVGREVIGTSRKGDFEYVAVDDCYRNEMTKVWDCRDVKPVAESGAKQTEKRLAQQPESSTVVVENMSTTNAPVRRTIRFVPRNRRGR